MNNVDIPGLLSGVLQVAVVICALRLIRLYGIARVGWSLVSAFGLLALPHLLLSIEPSVVDSSLELKAELTFGLVSILLLVGMAHLEALLRERRQARRAEERAQSELEVRVQEQTAELTRANEELQLTAQRLQAEITERAQMQEQMERTHNELLMVSRQAGMSEVATGVLHNVGNVLNSVNVSATLVADHLADFKISALTRIAMLMRDQGDNLGDFITHDPRGRQLPEYVGQLAKHLSEEQTLLVKEIGFVKQKIDHIKEIVATQQNYGKVSGLTERVNVPELVEDVLRMHSYELNQHAVQLQCEYEPDLSEIIVDKHKVLQILLNLISNAKYACIESGRPDKLLRVRVTNGDDRLRVILSDNGVGIPAANLKRIFNHGFTTKKKGGHGFGLHSGALAAKEMGGALFAHSDGPGLGATFTLELPLQPGSRPPELARALVPAAIAVPA
jgi:C4-dicarboxylate-specific signal transduction histidine kinase